MRISFPESSVMRRSWIFAHCWMPVLLFAVGSRSLGWAQQRAKLPPSGESRLDRASVKKFVTQHCFKCHNSDDKTAGLDLAGISGKELDVHSEVWEKVVRKLAARQMPPAGRARPDERTYESIVAALELELDRVAAAQSNPGRTPTLRRLNRTEYQNAIRDLLALDVDATALLPADEPNHGFDSAPLGDLSPTLLDRYITAAQKISRLAVGRAPKIPDSDIFRVP